MVVVIFQQMIVLFAMILCGVLAYKKKWIDHHGYQKLVTLVVNVFNPLLSFTAFSDTELGVNQAIVDNLILSILFYVFLMIMAFLYVHLFHIEGTKNKMYQLMLILPNVGFIGIPLTRALLGNEYVIYVVFYGLVFNFIAYTYGIYLAMGMSEEKKKYDFKQIFNIGTISSFVVVLLFVLKIQLPSSVLSFCDYMGNAAIPLSMVMVGISISRMNLKDVLNKEDMTFIVSKMIVVPLIGILIFKHFNFDYNLLIVFCMMISMPIGSMTGALSEEYGKCGDPCNRMIALTTALSVITVPLLAFFY